MIRAPSKEERRKEYDLFICHSSEDKEEIVRPLAKALIDAGFSVWYDEFELTLGDHLRRSIDKGLAQSKYGVVILSPHFFAKNWPQTELDGLAAKERDGDKVILPVWHQVDEPYVRKYSPTLADRIAARTEKGIDSIVTDISRALSRDSARQKQEELDKPLRNRLETAIEAVRGKYENEIISFVKETSFNNLRQTFRDVLNGIALFDLPQLPFDSGIFSFIEMAILERNEKEGTELFEILLDWFFQTVTSRARFEILGIFAKLTRLSFTKEVISRKGRSSAFVAEFGLSDSFEIAAINSEILMNIQNLLSDADLQRFVDFALTNDQIKSSWGAKRYLIKILALCEARINSPQVQELVTELT